MGVGGLLLDNLVCCPFICLSTSAGKWRASSRTREGTSCTGELALAGALAVRQIMQYSYANYLPPRRVVSSALAAGAEIGIRKVCSSQRQTYFPTAERLSSVCADRASVHGLVVRRWR